MNRSLLTDPTPRTPRTPRAAPISAAALAALVSLAYLSAAPRGVAAEPRAALGSRPSAVSPGNCTEHTPLSGNEDDYPGDYHCGGMAMKYHADGVDKASGMVWAGQWLFTDEAGRYRVGTCTFNRGTHPRADMPSSLTSQSFPNDPTMAKGAYLAWRYGESGGLVAAAAWVVFHYYAQDAGGTYMATNPLSPLVPSLAGVEASSGNPQLQERAFALDAEAELNAGPWTVTVTADRTTGASVKVTNAFGGRSGIAVQVRIGVADPVEVITGSNGVAKVVLPPAAVTAETATVIVAEVEAPGPLQIYSGTPAGPSGSMAQTLATAGTPETLRAEATLPPVVPGTVPELTTTTTTTVPKSTTTTTVPETTTTTTVAETTTTTVPETTTTTVPETTTTVPETTTTTVPDTTTTTTIPGPTPETPTVPPTNPTTTTTTEPVGVPDTTTPPTAGPQIPVPPRLPSTGKGSMSVAYLATLALVGGVGLLGTLRRRVKPVVGWWDDAADIPGIDDSGERS